MDGPASLHLSRALHALRSGNRFAHGSGIVKTARGNPKLSNEREKKHHEDRTVSTRRRLPDPASIDEREKRTRPLTPFPASKRSHAYRRSLQASHRTRRASRGWVGWHHVHPFTVGRYAAALAAPYWPSLDVYAPFEVASAGQGFKSRLNRYRRSSDVLRRRRFAYSALHCARRRV